MSEKQHGFLDDFIYYGSGTECPEPFLTWSGLSLLGAVAGRRVWYQHGDYFTIFPNLYVCLVGTAGSGKSAAMGLAEEVFIKHFPSYFVSASIQSREDILKQMGRDECVQFWKDEKGEYGLPGELHPFRPYYAVVDELENFVSVDKEKMIGMLVGIYSRNSYSTGFKNDPNPNQKLSNPCLSMIACTVPEWIMGSLRMDLFTKGLGRRLVIVHCQKTKLNDDPRMPVGGKDALARVVKHLQEVEKFYGCFVMDDEARAWWKEWYYDKTRFNRDDPILMQFHETKHVMLLKVAILLAMNYLPLTRFIRKPHLVAALSMLNRLEGDVVRLTSGIGRNQLAGISAQLVEFLQRMGGAAGKIPVKKTFYRYCNTPEWTEMLQHMVDTQQIIVAQGNNNLEWYFLPERYAAYVKEQEARRSQPPQAET